MKTLMLIIAFGTINLQSFGQEAFKNVALENVNSREVIKFIVSREVNTRYYRIEAGNDTLSFEVIATVPSKGNSMLGRNYTYDVQNHHYKYYRVGVVSMNANLSYSTVVTPQQKVLPVVPERKSDHLQAGASIVNKR